MLSVKVANVPHDQVKAIARSLNVNPGSADHGMVEEVLRHGTDNAYTLLHIVRLARAQGADERLLVPIVDLISAEYNRSSARVREEVVELTKLHRHLSRAVNYSPTLEG